MPTKVALAAWYVKLEGTNKPKHDDKVLALRECLKSVKARVPTKEEARRIQACTCSSLRSTTSPITPTQKCCTTKTPKKASFGTRSRA